MDLNDNYLVRQTGRKVAKFWSNLFESEFYRKQNTYHNKLGHRLYHADIDRHDFQINKLKRRFNEKARWSWSLQDNLFRLTGLAFLERLSVVRQSSLFNSSLEFTTKNNTQANLTAIKQQGLFRGFLRGSLLNMVGFMGINVQAYVNSNGDFNSFLGSLLVLETALFPLDTLRVQYQADIQQKSTFINTINKVKPGQLYSGLPNKLIFAQIYSFFLTKGPCDSITSFISNLPYLLAAYPFLTLKTVSQVTLNSQNPVSNLVGSLTIGEKFLKLEGIRALYRGFLPFLALSTFAGHYFPKLWSKEVQETELGKLGLTFDEKLAKGKVYKDDVLF